MRSPGLTGHAAQGFTAWWGAVQRPPSESPWRIDSVDSELKPASDKRVRRLFTSLYIWLNILIGCGVLSWALVNWQCEDWLRFASFLVTGVIASVLRIRLPGTDGTASVSALFILIGIVDLGTPEALMIGALCAIAQTTWRSQARLIQIAFTTCTRATAIYVSALAYGYTRSRTFELACLGVLTAIYFLATAIPVAGIISLTERKSLGSIFKGSRWMPPYYFVGASMAWLIGTVPHSIQWELPIICLPLVYVVHRSNRTLVTQVEREKKHVEQMNAVHLRTIEALALAIDAKDHTTHDHLQRVQIYAIEIAKDLKVPEHELEALRAAAVLHDIGKLAVPEHIISKPGKLTR